jgi:hypothetical protein
MISSRKGLVQQGGRYGFSTISCLALRQAEQKAKTASSDVAEQGSGMAVLGSSHLPCARYVKIGVPPNVVRQEQYQRARQQRRDIGPC